VSFLVRLWLPVLVWAALIFALSSVPDLGTGLGTWDLVLRKLAHTGEYAVLGALLIGFIQAFNEGLTWYTPGSDWTRSIVFGILIAILVFRPEGILGERTPEGA